MCFERGMHFKVWAVLDNVGYMGNTYKSHIPKQKEMLRGARSPENVPIKDARILIQGL